MVNIIKLIRSADLLGQGINLKINNKTISKTFIGGLLTVVIILSSISMFYFNGQDLFFHKHPQINIEQQVLSKNSNITLNKTTMPISLFLTGENNEALEMNEYLIITAQHIYGDTLGNMIEKQLNIVLCKKEYFPLLDNHTFYEFRINTHYCIENMNVPLYGSWGEPVIAYLSIKLSMCKNETEKYKCKSKNEIEKFLTSTQYYYLNVFFVNSVINPENYKAPLTYYVYEFYKCIFLNSKKHQLFFVREEILETDDNFIFEDKILNNNINIDSSYSDESPILNNNNNDLMEIEIYSSNYEVTYHRRYIKIQTILANVGGIANILKFIFIVCTYIFSIVKRDEVILNKIFEFDFTQTHNMERLYENGNYVDNQKNKNSIQSVNNNDRYFSFEKGNPNNYNLNSPNTKIRMSKLIQKNLDVNSITSEKNNYNLNLHQSKNSVNDYNSHKFFTRNTKHTFSSTSQQYNSRVLVQKKEQFSLRRNESKIKTVDNNPELFQHKTGKQIINILNSKNKKQDLRFSFSEVVRAFLCCKCFMSKYLKTKKALYEKRRFAVNEYLDIAYIVQKFEELEKLKIVLFDDNQLALFNFIAKEIISLDEDKMSTHHITHYKNFNKNREQLVNIIVNFREKMINNIEVQNIDKKLFSLLNPIFI